MNDITITKCYRIEIEDDTFYITKEQAVELYHLLSGEVTPNDVEYTIEERVERNISALMHG